MPVLPATFVFHWAGSTGSIDRNGPTEYTALYRVRVDDPLDQAQIVIQWFITNQFGPGTPYSYANDILGSLATATNFGATRQLETTDWWIIEVTYSREDDAARRDTGDNHTTDPLLYRPIVRCSSNAVSVPGQRLKYESGYGDRVRDILFAQQASALDGKTTPQNSAEVPFDPFPQINSFHWYISVQQNLATFDANDSKVGFTNSLSFRVDYKGFTRGPVAPDQCMIRDCEVFLQRENTVDFWNVTYYFEVKPDGEDFLHHLIDLGLSATAIEGRPDGHGGVFGQAAGNTPVPEDIKRAPVRGITDAHELPLRKPIPFDGDGEALPPGSSELVVGLWSEDKRTDYNELPVIKEIIGELIPPP